MESTSATPASDRTTSNRITLGIASGVVVLAIIFAFQSAWYTHWYALFRVTHVVTAVFWVGGGLLLTVLGLRAEHLDDADETAAVVRQAAFAGQRLFAPAGGIVLVMGIAMMINTDWGWGKFWVVAGLIGYAATFFTGLAVLTPLVKKLDGLLQTQGAAAPESKAVMDRILLIARIDTAVLLLVVADMVTKPFS